MTGLHPCGYVRHSGLACIPGSPPVPDNASAVHETTALKNKFGVLRAVVGRKILSLCLPEALPATHEFIAHDLGRREWRE